MRSTTETKRLQTDRDRAVRRRLRAGLLRLGDYLGWDRQKVVRFSEAAAGRPWRRCDRTALLQVLGAFAEVAARVRAGGQVSPMGDSTDHELARVHARVGAAAVSQAGLTGSENGWPIDRRVHAGGKPSVSSP
jgi:hypothetical protein